MFTPETRAAIEKIAGNLNVPPAALLAVVDVESGGRMSANIDGKEEPLIRFEGHYFDRFLRGEKREQARKAKLANPVPGKVKNPRTQKARWNLLRKASLIDRPAALSSCSWGVGQVMGAHWKWLGYGSPDALVAEARSGVEGQVKLMARYIDRAGLAGALNDQSWDRFARAYNGPCYAKNRYAERMAKAFAKYSKEPAAHSHKKPPPAEGTLSFGSRGPRVSDLQSAMTKKGYLLVVDGFFGLVTDRVVRQFQRDHFLTEDGIIGKRESALIFDQPNRLGRILKTIASPARGTTGATINDDLTRNIRKGLLSIFSRFA